MKSAFQNISEMNTAFGNLFGSCVKEGKVIDYKKLLNQSKNLYDELDEMKDDGFALLIKDPESKEGRTGLVDAIGDVIVFLYGVPHFLGSELRTSAENIEFHYNEIISYNGNDKYDEIYKNAKSLIDDIIQSINDEASVDEIMDTVSELDAYINALCNYYNVDLTLLIDLITLSNMSKLCQNEDEQNLTLKKYQDDGVVVHAQPSPLLQSNGSPYLVVYSSIEQTVKGKVYRANKFLKCVNWFEPDLANI